MLPTQGQSINQSVQWVAIDSERAGQRLDNFLMSQLRDLPKTRIYRMVRSGEVRVNKGRKAVSYRLQDGDTVRIPPVTRSAEPDKPALPQRQVEAFDDWVLYESDDLLAVNKPAGLAVHGGSGLDFGLIELARKARPDCRSLELVHRLDRDTSGVILLAKKRSALRVMHDALRNRTAHKTYWALVSGRWPKRKEQVKLPLSRDVLKSGERIATVDVENGKFSLTKFAIRGLLEGATWVAAEPVTGRTHQIRVHCQAAGYPILGDPKYGRAEDNAHWKTRGLNRMFLHAARLDVPWQDSRLIVEAPLEASLQTLLQGAQHDPSE